MPPIISQSSEEQVRNDRLLSPVILRPQEMITLTVVPNFVVFDLGSKDVIELSKHRLVSKQAHQSLIFLIWYKGYVKNNDSYADGRLQQTA